MRVVFATATQTVGWRGRLIRMHAGDPWAADDEFVADHPQWFSDECNKFVRRTGPAVESATADPADRRQVRRG